MAKIKVVNPAVEMDGDASSAVHHDKAHPAVFDVR
jgi:hypothetical protein